MTIPNEHHDIENTKGSSEKSTIPDDQLNTNESTEMGPDNHYKPETSVDEHVMAEYDSPYVVDRSSEWQEQERNKPYDWEESKDISDTVSPTSMKKAISTGFKETFNNPGAIIGGTAIILIFSAGLSVLTQIGVNVGFNYLNNLYLELSGSPLIASQSAVGTVDVSGISGILGFILGIFLARAGLQVLDHGKITWSQMFSGTRFFPAAGASIVTGFLHLLAILFGSLILIVPLLSVFNVSIFNGTSGSLLMTTALLFAVFVGIIMFTSPFFRYSTYLALDGEDVTDTVKETMKIGSYHYWKIIGWSIIIFMITFFGTIFTLGIGMIVIIPAMIIAESSYYRQLRNGNDSHLHKIVSS